MRERQERIHGPFQHGARWRVVVVGADGSRSYPRESPGGPGGFASRTSATAYIDSWRQAGDERTISTAIADYLAILTQRGIASVTTTGYRLRGLLLTAERDRPLPQLTGKLAKQLLEQRASEVKVDTQIGELADATRFGAWCVEQGWLATNPFAELRVLGKRARGKKKLRINEARRFIASAVGERSEAGLAAAIALLMGTRASEIVDRQVRDVDDDGAVLWIDRAKTAAGDRGLEVPTVLRAQLLGQAGGRDPEAPLFPGRTRYWVYYHVQRICRVAGVPVISPHGLRGTQASIAVQAAPAEQVAAQLGQVGPAVTRRHYLAPGSEETGVQRAALRVLQGGHR